MEKRKQLLRIAKEYIKKWGDKWEGKWGNKVKSLMGKRAISMKAVIIAAAGLVIFFSILLSFAIPKSQAKEPEPDQNVFGDGTVSLAEKPPEKKTLLTPTPTPIYNPGDPQNVEYYEKEEIRKMKVTIPFLERSAAGDLSYIKKIKGTAAQMQVLETETAQEALNYFLKGSNYYQYYGKEKCEIYVTVKDLHRIMEVLLAQERGSITYAEDGSLPKDIDYHTLNLPKTSILFPEPVPDGEVYVFQLKDILKVYGLPEDLFDKELEKGEDNPYVKAVFDKMLKTNDFAGKQIGLQAAFPKDVQHFLYYVKNAEFDKLEEFVGGSRTSYEDTMKALNRMGYQEKNRFYEDWASSFACEITHYTDGDKSFCILGGTLTGIGLQKGYTNYTQNFPLRVFSQTVKDSDLNASIEDLCTVIEHLIEIYKDGRQLL